MKKTVFKPLSALEAAIMAADTESLIRIIVYGSRFAPPPCADPEPHPTDAIQIGFND